MRQTGILVASAAYALNNNFSLLVNVHALARKVQKGLEDIGVTILSPAETCMVRVCYTAPYARSYSFVSGFLRCV